ncbi:MAG: hypothetical protein DRR19_13720 [Candidatus Parabeggiatoa sp. nov. 1]|nr:MAG: hypothetical protein DRR19_13720 [Gammaproteobacteria bacterium]
MKPSYDELEKRLAQINMILDAIRSGKVDNILGTNTLISLQPQQVDEALESSHRRLQKLLHNAENIIHSIRDGKVDNIVGFKNTFTVQLKKTHDAVVQAHHELEERTVDLVTANEALQTEIAERQQIEKNFKEKNDSLETFYKLAINRELKMIELKKEINQLLADDDKPPRYEIASL